MAQDKGKCVKGRVVEILPSDLYRVDLGSGRFVQAHLASQMRLHCVRLLPGDEVNLELSPYDTSRGHITGRVER